MQKVWAINNLFGMHKGSILNKLLWKRISRERSSGSEKTTRTSYLYRRRIKNKSPRPSINHVLVPVLSCLSRGFIICVWKKWEAEREAAFFLPPPQLMIATMGLGTQHHKILQIYWLCCISTHNGWVSALGLFPIMLFRGMLWEFGDVATFCNNIEDKHN